MTGNTLFWLSDGVDAGDIIDQTPIPITPYDTCASLYRHVAVANRDMILRAIPATAGGGASGPRAGDRARRLLPERRPADGRLDWTRPSNEVYNFVRALTRPYPGAFTDAGADRLTIWHCACLPIAAHVRAQARGSARPGRVSRAGACGQLIACGQGAVVLLEIERQDGTRIRGRSLSDLRGRDILGSTKVPALSRSRRWWNIQLTDCELLGRRGRAGAIDI